MTFYKIHTKAVEELERAVAAELEVDDPPAEQAEAIMRTEMASGESNPSTN